MSFITTRFQEILLSGFKGFVLINCFRSIFDFSKIKKGVTPRKNFLWIIMYIYIRCVTTTKFHKILLSGFRGVTLTNCFSCIFHFSKFKKGVTPRKKMNQNFLWICESTNYVLHNYTVSRNSVERFQRSCAYKKNRTDGLTDGRVKNIIPSETRCVGYNKFGRKWARGRRSRLNQQQIFCPNF